MKSYLVLGLGKFGVSFGRAIVNMGHEVMGVDTDHRLVQQYANVFTCTMEADATAEDFFPSVGISNFDAVIVAIGDNFQACVMATLLLKEQGARYILAKALDDFQAKVLYKVGADKVIQPEVDTGRKVAINLITGNFLEGIELSGNYSIVSITAPHVWVGKTLGEISPRTKYGVNIIVIKNDKKVNMMPNTGTIVNQGDMLTLLGANVNLRKVESLEIPK